MSDKQPEALRLADLMLEKPDSDGHCMKAAAELRRLLDAVRAIVAERDECSKLRDPATLHVNLLRGEPAQLTREMLLHLLGDAAPQPVGEVEDAAMHAALRSSVKFVAKGVPVGGPAENSAEWFQREIQRLQQHVAETWPDWMKRTSGISTATFPTVGEVPMPEAGPICFAMAQDVLEYKLAPRVGNHIPGVYDVALYAKDQLRTYGDARYQQGYAAGLTAALRGEVK